MKNKINYETTLATAIQAAQSSGKIIQNYYLNLCDISNKKHSGDLVTEADKESEKNIIEMIQKNYPNHEILAEESGHNNIFQSDYLWAIDPLDGTTNYVHGFSFFAISIALLYKNNPLIGVVLNPISNELFYTIKGKGSFLNNKKLKVSQTKKLEKSILSTGFPYNRKEISDNNLKEFCYLTNLTQGVRRTGCASLDLAYVAAGIFDGFWEKGLNPWDISAGALLVKEARGQVTSLQNTPIDLMKGEILATNALIHDEISQKLIDIAPKSLSL